MLSVFHAPECSHAEWVNAQLHGEHCFPLQHFFAITFSVVVKVKMEICFISFFSYVCIQTLIDSPRLALGIGAAELSTKNAIVLRFLSSYSFTDGLSTICLWLQCMMMMNGLKMHLNAH